MMKISKRIEVIIDVLDKMYPHASCELNYQTPFQLAVAVMLSAQTTDKAVNIATKDLFANYLNASDFLKLSVAEIEKYIKRIGLYKNKAKNLHRMAEIISNDYNDVLPNKRADLEALPGVGRKTTNVILTEVFQVPAFAVDTHVERISIRLGLAKKGDSVYKIEEKLKRKFPREKWIKLHHQMIFFGRYHCKSRNPNCKECLLKNICKHNQL